MTRKEIRETAGLTQAELAQKLGVCRATVQRFEYGSSQNRKLQAFYAKQEKVNIRAQYGFTQREIARQVGVSVATVGRYERGGENKQVAEFFKNMEKNADLWNEFNQLRHQAINRLRKLEDVEFSPARAWLDDRGMVPYATAIGKSRREFKQDIATLSQFLEMQTSTVSGTKKWLENVEEASMRTSQSADRDENEIFWKLFNRLKNDKSVSKYWRKGYFDSDQAVADIQAVMVYSYAGYETVDELYNILTRR